MPDASEEMRRQVEEALQGADGAPAAAPPTEESQPEQKPSLIPDRPKPPSADRINIESEMGQREAFADAHVLISRAIVRAGRNPAAPQPGDSDAMADIYGILLKVQGAR